MLPPAVCDTAPSAIVTEPDTAFTSIVLVDAAPAVTMSPAADWVMLPWAIKVTEPLTTLMPAFRSMLPASTADTRLALSNTLPLPVAVIASLTSSVPSWVTPLVNTMLPATSRPDCAVSVITEPVTVPPTLTRLTVTGTPAISRPLTSLTYRLPVTDALSLPMLVSIAFAPVPTPAAACNLRLLALTLTETSAPGTSLLSLIEPPETTLTAPPSGLAPAFR